MGRLAFLDSYRAIAITAVAGFHFFARWSPPISEISAYPYGDLFADVAVFKLGSFGINLFFLISGFVITFTLQSCDSFFEFAVKRIARLWPALIVCTAMIYVLRLSPFGLPGSGPRPLDLVSSLTTAEPKLLAALGIHSEYVIGSVWTLFVELRFYALAAFAYFFLSRGQFVLGLLAFSAVSMAAALARGSLEGGIGMVLTSVTLVRSIGWFALGAYCFTLHTGTRTPAETGLAVVNWVLVVAVYWVYPPHLSPDLLTPRMPSALITLAMPALFALSVVMPALQKPLERPWLIKIGVVSYSLYLIHEAVGVALISRISPSLPTSVQLALVAAVYVGLIALASLIFVLVENPGREFVRRIVLGNNRHTHERRVFEAAP